MFGTAYNANMRPVVCKAESIEGIQRFNGSKYVQSDLAKTLPQIIEKLKIRKFIFASGTPCQIAAVKTFCKDYVSKNLITMDVVCYGVPRPGLFRKFLDVIEQKTNAKVVDYRFRDKHTHGWSYTTVIRMVGMNGKKLYYEEEDYSEIPYYKMFGARNCFRKECYSCSYNSVERISDFTTGNFWKIDEMTDAFDTHLGVSMLLLNTELARTLFKKVANRYQVLDMTFEQAVYANDALIHTCEYSKEQDEIYRYMEEQGFESMFKKYYSEPLLRKIKKKVKKGLLRIIPKEKA